MKKIGLFLLTLILFSCSKEKSTFDKLNSQTEPNCISCAIEPHTQIKITIGGMQAKYNVWNGGSVTLQDSHYSLARKDFSLNPQKIKSILKQLQWKKYIKSITDYQLVNIIFFANNIIKSNLIVKKSDIKGILLYFEKNDRLFSLVFKVSKNKALVPINELKATPGFISSDAYYLCAQIFKKDISQNIIAISLLNSSSIPSLHYNNGF